MRKRLLFGVTFILFLSVCLQGVAQTQTISGKVTDGKTGEGVPGLSVVIKGTTSGTITDVDGKYQMNATVGATLIFQAVGYITQEKTVGTETTLNVTMPLDTKQLEEVVVTALGIEREKSSLGYSVQTIGGDDAVKARETNIVNSLAGKVAGVQVTNSSGSAGASSRIIIRGNSSFTGNNQPLFVIDGVPVDNSQTFQGGQNNSNGNGTGDSPLFFGGTSNRAVDINPENIESISVLSGASATALYGVRAANGVVLITTKNGVKGSKKPTVTYGYNIAFDEARLPELQDTYAQGLEGVYRSGLDNDNSVKGSTSWGPRIDELRLGADGEEDPNGTPAQKYNNAEDFFRTGVSQTHSISLAGGGENSTYYLSYTNLFQEGITINNYMSRDNVLAKITSDLSDKLSIETSISYVKNKLRQATEGNGVQSYLWTVYGAPISYNLKGDNERDYLLPDGTQRLYRTGRNNPYFLMFENGRFSEIDRYIGNVKLSYDVLPWLNISTRLGIDSYADDRSLQEAIGTVGTPAGRYFTDNIKYRQLNNDFVVSMNKRFGDWGVSVILGNQINEIFNRRVFTLGSGLNIPEFYNLSNATTISTNENTTKTRLVGIYGQATVDYKNFAFLTITGRNDWASVLPIDNNSFFYPSVSGSVVLTEAIPALQDNKILSYGKVRASWAQAGNVGSAYNTQETLFFQSSVGDGQRGNITSPFNGQNGFAITNSIGEPNLQNELTDEIELGLELGFFNNRANVEFTYYDRNTKNQILTAPAAGSAGIVSRTANAGKIQNSGIEAVVSGTPIQYKGFDWNLGVSFTKNNSTVIELVEGVDEIRLAGFTSPGIYLIKDQSYGVIYGSRYVRDDQDRVIIDDDPTSARYGLPAEVDQSKLYSIGNTLPDWEMGIRNTFSYQNEKLGRFSLGAVLQIRQGGDILNLDNFYMNFYGVTKASEERTGAYVDSNDPTQGTTGPSVVYEGVTSDGSANTISVPLNENYWRSNWGAAQEDWVEDGSYVRLREVTFQYNLPSSLLSKTPFGDVGITVTGRNLFLDAPNFSGADPESSLYGSANGQGFYNFITPNTYGWNFALNVTF